jgi:SAM-dependent methyltransferase
MSSGGAHTPCAEHAGRRRDQFAPRIAVESPPWWHFSVSSDFPRITTGPAANGYDPAAYGDGLGADYDELYPDDQLETEATVAFLAALAECHPDHSVLELGIGTGRLALALHRRGLAVDGIEASRRMVAVLRQKDPDADIEVRIGDFISTCMDRTYGVVALVLNNVLDDRGVDAQLQLFRNAARHVAPGGCFVIEAFVLPDEQRDGSWTVVPRYVGEHHAELQLIRFDVETSMVERTLVHLRPEGPRFLAVKEYYSSPGELDIMARVSGLTRAERYSTWARAPFTARSRRHITVYRRPW